MPRRTTTETTEAILDNAAGLLASLGPRDLSVQAVADATSLAKSSILYHFGSRQGLLDAAVQQCVREAVGLTEVTGDDRARLRALAELSLDRPGWIRLVIAGVTNLHGTEVAAGLRPAIEALYGLFGVDIENPLADPDRAMRVTGTLGALAIFVIDAPPLLPPAARLQAVEDVCAGILEAGRGRVAGAAVAVS